MIRIATTLLALLILHGQGTSLPAASRAELVTQSEAQQLGMERAWFTRTAINSAVGQIEHITQHISSKQSYTVFELSYDVGKQVFSERDLDRLGQPLGVEGARKLARLRREELEELEMNPSVSERTVPVITLYVTTNRGIVQALDGETGQTNWISVVGRPGQELPAAGANDDFVATLNGSTLYLLNSADGKIIWQKRIKGAAAAGPVLSDQLLFLPMIDGKVEVHNLDDSEISPPSFSIHGARGDPNVEWGCCCLVNGSRPPLHRPSQSRSPPISSRDRTSN